ncbi:hypothetical protein WH8501_06205 [Crocosphaera watsonii WH 8501]|uniref:DUF7734 domain-containing protein n=1 Tax=Crocosphaera watsonii WH 8501 TaxID=165597 RepID=Q4C4Z9_CROWT|nr:hypothetical protein [Crocosphaera watsonii]EAM51313.1 hypothetical protein CwatDRAFT_4390 [Crocosphaera watsonii WH 8501]
MSLSKIQQLEKYTIKHPQEVLLITVVIEEEKDKVMIFKGFSSSLMGSTEFNAEIPLISETAEIISIDRLQSPYNPQEPKYIEKGLTWEKMENLF